MIPSVIAPRRKANTGLLLLIKCNGPYTPPEAVSGDYSFTLWLLPFENSHHHVIVPDALDLHDRALSPSRTNPQFS